MKVFVLGAGGRLGTELASVLPQMVSLPRSVDVTRRGDVERACVGASLVVNLAAFTDVRACEDRSRTSSFDVNAFAPGEVALACRALDVPLLHVSTDYVFGGGVAPYAPWDDACPTCAYGRDKAEGEERALAGWRRTVVARMCFLPFPFEHERVFSGVVANREFADDAARRLAAFVRALLSGRVTDRLIHLVRKDAVDLSDLVRGRHPLVSTVPVEVGSAHFPYAYPKDTRLSEAWEDPSCSES